MGGATGVVFNVQRYSLHDGPGIRTTLFLKGCPLRCAWCHNPESQHALPEVMYSRSRCVGCGACVSACPRGAIRLDRLGGSESFGISAGARNSRDLGCSGGSEVIRNRSLCSECGECVARCPTGARTIAGKEMTSGEALREILKDRVFFDESGGGVTFSGGEPLYQPEFLEETLRLCKEEGLTTTLDTSGFAPWQVLERVIPYVDLVLYDVKTLDDDVHRRYVGASNAVILENLRRLTGTGKRVVARIPVIPGVNDDSASVESAGRFLSSVAVAEVHVLPYHDIGADKYRRLGREYALDGMVPPADWRIEEIVDELSGFGLRVRIGG